MTSAAVFVPCEASGCSLPGLLRCGKCKFVNYCSASCQKAAFRAHKDHCKALVDAPAIPKVAAAAITPPEKTEASAAMDADADAVAAGAEPAHGITFCSPVILRDRAAVYTHVPVFSSIN